MLAERNGVASTPHSGSYPGRRIGLSFLSEEGAAQAHYCGWRETRATVTECNETEID